MNVERLWEALYAINRALPMPSEASFTDQKALHDARDRVWELLVKHDPTHTNWG